MRARRQAANLGTAMDMTTDQARGDHVREIGSPAEILRDPAAYEAMADQLQQGRILVSRQVLSTQLTRRITEYREPLLPAPSRVSVMP